MIQKFNQFINESVSGAQNPLSVHEKINEPFTDFVERAQERFNNFMEHITYLLNQMDKAIGEVMEDFDYAVVGEPNIVVASDLQEIEVFFNTNIPNNDDVWKADKSPALDLESRLYSWFKEYENIRTEIYYKPNDEGNCVIALQAYIIDDDVFEEFTDAIKILGSKYTK